MNATQAMTMQRNAARPRRFVTVPACAIAYPGVYVTQQGHMLRVFGQTPADDTPGLSWELLDGLLVTRVSEDPRTPIPACRTLAREAGLQIHF